MNVILPCPVCPVEVEVSEEDPDASLSDLWSHLGQHEWEDRHARNILFVEAQHGAREVP